jgi:hypothetical protein
MDHPDPAPKILDLAALEMADHVPDGILELGQAGGLAVSSSTRFSPNCRAPAA